MRLVLVVVEEVLVGLVEVEVLKEMAVVEKVVVGMEELLWLAVVEEGRCWCD